MNGMNRATGRSLRLQIPEMMPFEREATAAAAAAFGMDFGIPTPRYTWQMWPVRPVYRSMPKGPDMEPLFLARHSCPAGPKTDTQ